MNRIPFRLLIVLLLIAACEPAPQGSDSDTTAVVTSPDAGADESAAGGPASGEGANRKDGDSDPGVALQTILDGAFQRDPQTQDLTVLDELNEPSRVDVETRPNRHVRGQTDTLRTLRYDGLDLTVYHVSDGKEILQTVSVTDERFRTDRGLHVGMSRGAIEATLGQPTRRSGNEYVYDLGGQLPTMLHVAFSTDIVSRLEWKYPVD